MTRITGLDDGNGALRVERLRSTVVDLEVDANESGLIGRAILKFFGGQEVHDELLNFLNDTSFSLRNGHVHGIPGLVTRDSGFVIDHQIGDDADSVTGRVFVDGEEGFGIGRATIDFDTVDRLTLGLKGYFEATGSCAPELRRIR